MLWTSSTIKDYEIEVSDGQIGTLNDLLCDDVRWKLRWVVVNTGPALFDRTVLVPGKSITSIDRALGKVHVELSTSDVAGSPHIASGDMTLRKTEISLSDYFAATPHSDAQDSDAQVDRKTVLHTDGNESNLRSLNVLRGYTIEASDGSIGYVTDFLINDNDWSIRYIVVDTGTWLPGQKVVIAPNSVSAIDGDEKKIHLKVDREKVKSAPPYDPSMTIDGNYDEKFLTYYGIRWLEG